ncbi:hypothetical protein CUZ89_1724 [Enterococcus xinjiangensis]|uniref:Uncharacterized protein n=1 Tax=Enterococcus faecium SD2A-2 TaxID=1244154 RepID=A0AB73ACP9_ENTFC|nr:hypothetical protein HMPREF0352_0844 [Enterococcus faecium TX1330]EFF60274.1 hypothetical protein CUO_1374 [Enterococcus faecium PC4.1]EJV56615.1 hypothetical protein HMPREF1345_00374 [Enterococcus faecium TX1337RF]EPI15522.1 hypothetical protein D356_00283 [Enterococcus faecium SD2A-2]MBL5003541.1 hypothetical protein [Enterococcus lactis]SJX67343.1 hypothetical protein FM130_00645 [Enterococcus faecium]
MSIVFFSSQKSKKVKKFLRKKGFSFRKRILSFTSGMILVK